MKKNIGTIDRAIRAIVGIAFIATAFLYPGLGPWSFYGSIVIGVIMLGTAALGWCPPYVLMGINTCAKKDS
ncbi:MAG: DUF2892 domain-containing protein [Rhodospirillaceae bacterium]|nr:DUF2892 domain-containing protein [Rhodospirillaceae bacterium]